MDTQTLILAALIAFFAASTQAVTGFGFALIYAPLLAVAWEVKPAVPTTAMLSLLVNVLVLAQVRGHVNYGRLPGMYLGYAIGVVPGLIVLGSVSGDALRLIVAAVVLTATIVLYAAPAIDAGRDSLAARVVAGAFSGASASSTGIGGPPVVLYMLGREKDVQRFRATLLAYFMPMSIVTLSLLAAVGRVNNDVLTVAAVSVPAVIAGVVLGSWARQHVHPEVFRRVVMALLVGMSTLLIVFTVFGIG